MDGYTYTAKSKSKVYCCLQYIIIQTHLSSSYFLAPWATLATTTHISQSLPHFDLFFLFQFLEPPLLHPLHNLLVHHFRLLRPINPLHFPLFFKIFHDGHTRLEKGLETFLDAFDIVVGAAGGFAAVNQAILEDGFGDFEKKGEGGGADFFVEFDGLVHFAGEA